MKTDAFSLTGSEIIPTARSAGPLFLPPIMHRGQEARGVPPMSELMPEVLCKQIRFATSSGPSSDAHRNWFPLS